MKITARALAKMTGKDERYIYTLLGRHGIRLTKQSDMKNLFLLMARIVVTEKLDEMLLPERQKKKKLARLSKLQKAIQRRR